MDSPVFHSSPSGPYTCHRPTVRLLVSRLRGRAVQRSVPDLNESGALFVLRLRPWAEIPLLYQGDSLRISRSGSQKNHQLDIESVDLSDCRSKACLHPAQQK